MLRGSASQHTHFVELFLSIIKSELSTLYGIISASMPAHTTAAKGGQSGMGGASASGCNCLVFYSSASCRHSPEMPGQHKKVLLRYRKLGRKFTILA